jgi:membrane-bound ClpP family serine protease
MSTGTRAMIAVPLMTVGLVALVVQGIDNGWSALGVAGAACFAVAIAAELTVLRRSRAQS